MLNILEDVRAKKVDLYLHKQAIDTSTLPFATRTSVEVVKSAYTTALEGFALPYGDVAVGTATGVLRTMALAVRPVRRRAGDAKHGAADQRRRLESLEVRHPPRSVHRTLFMRS